MLSPEGELTGAEEATVVNQIHHALRPFLLRRTRDEVFAGELKEKREVVVRCELSGCQRAIYSSLKSKGQELLLGRGSDGSEGGEEGGVRADAAVVRMRNVSNVVMQLRKVRS